MPLPDWWCYPKRCENGHDWGPGRVLISWVACTCPPVLDDPSRGSGHTVVYCGAEGCASAWWQPPHQAEG